MRILTTSLCLGLGAVLCATGVWAGSTNSSGAAANDKMDHAWTVNGMQVIKVRPEQRSRIYARRNDNGEWVMTHEPPAQSEADND